MGKHRESLPHKGAGREAGPCGLCLGLQRQEEMTLQDLYNRAVALQTQLQDGSLVRNVMMQHEADIYQQQQIQLLEGKSSSGEDLRPYYSEDLRSRGGWFHTAESAGRYAAWKQDLSYPYSVNRNPDAPNLYINGRFHSEIGVEFRADSVAVIPLTGYAEIIMAKYGLQNFGLSSEKWAEIFRERGAYDELMQEVKRIINN